MKIRLHYTDIADSMSDFSVEGRYQASLGYIAHHKLEYHETMTSNLLMVYRFRVGLVEGDFDELEVVNGTPAAGKIHVVSPKNGSMDWTDFPDFHMDLLLKLASR